MAETVQIKILNWEKFNTRKDVTNPRWFRLEHNLFEHWQFYDFTHSEIIAWVYMLCEASKRNEGGTVTVNMEHAHRIARLDSTAINSAIRKLKQNQVIEVRTSRGRYANVTNPGTTRHNSTLHNKTGQDITVATGTESGPIANADESLTPSQQVWNVYAESYKERYGVEPARNVQVNSQIKAFVSKGPEEDAHHIARFYVWHNDRFYVQKAHPVGLMVSDYQKLRTEWATGKKATLETGKQAELRDSNVEVMRRFIEAKQGGKV